DGKDKDKLAAGGPAPSYVWTGSGGTCGGNPDFFAAASASAVNDVQVICDGCDVSLSHELIDDGGFCADCREKAATAAATAAGIE
ncbi:SWEET14, partial [Symbiodinium pilosum]